MVPLNRIREYLIKNYPFNIVVILVFALLFFFMFYKVSKASINNDAHFWYQRSQNFTQALIEKKWVKTYQNPKPGVTVMLVSGTSLELFFRLFESIHNYRPDILSSDTFAYVHFAAVGPLILITFMCLILIYYLVSRLLNSYIALLSIILVGFQPFILGISRSFHSDSFVSVFMTLSVLTLLYALIQKKYFFWISVSGIFAGLSILSKSSAIYLIPYFILTLIMYIYFYHSDFLKIEKIKRKNIIFRLVILVVVWIISLALTSFLLFPALWVDTIRVLKDIFIVEGLGLVTQARDGANPFYYYIEPIYRILTPIYLVSFVFGIFAIIKTFKKLNIQQKFIYTSVLFYMFFYIVQMSIVQQKMDRYIMPLFYIGAIIGGYGIYFLIHKYFKKDIVIMICVFLFINLLFVFYYFPNYLLYPSENAKDQFGCSLCSDIGEYLNSQPDPYDLKIVFSSEKLHKLQPFVKGRVYTKNEILPNNWTPEYYVKENDQPVIEQYSHCKKVQDISFRNVVYWNILKCKGNSTL